MAKKTRPTGPLLPTLQAPSSRNQILADALARPPVINNSAQLGVNLLAEALDQRNARKQERQAAADQDRFGQSWFDAHSATNAPAAINAQGDGNDIGVQASRPQMAPAQAQQIGRLRQYWGAGPYGRQVALQGMANFDQPQGDGYTLSPGQVRYGPDGTQQAAVPGNPTAADGRVVVNQGGVLVDKVTGQAVYKNPGRPPPPAPTMRSNVPSGFDLDQ